LFGLPALGEVDIKQVTLEEFIATVPVRAVESPEFQVLKHDAKMAEVLHRALWSKVRFPSDFGPDHSKLNFLECLLVSDGHTGGGSARRAGAAAEVLSECPLSDRHEGHGLAVSCFSAKRNATQSPGKPTALMTQQTGYLTLSMLAAVTLESGIGPSAIRTSLRSRSGAATDTNNNCLRARILRAQVTSDDLGPGRVMDAERQALAMWSRTRPRSLPCNVEPWPGGFGTPR
jgi:hypothetical protein